GPLLLFSRRPNVVQSIGLAGGSGMSALANGTRTRRHRKVTKRATAPSPQRSARSTERISTSTSRYGGNSVLPRHEATTRCRRQLRPRDQALQPEDEPLHLRGAQRHLHHRPAEDPRRKREGLQLLARRSAPWRYHPVRRRQEA